MIQGGPGKGKAVNARNISPVNGPCTGSSEAPAWTPPRPLAVRPRIDVSTTGEIAIPGAIDFTKVAKNSPDPYSAACYEA